MAVVVVPKIMMLVHEAWCRRDDRLVVAAFVDGKLDDREA